MINQTEISVRDALAQIVIRKPSVKDGVALADLIQRCPPLDHNSLYCNLLQCSLFADTAVVAYLGSQLVGAVTGFLKPSDPGTLFVWQVAVAPDARGNNLAGAMVRTILKEHPQVRFFETTITVENRASESTFTRLARSLDCKISHRIIFDQTHHFAGHHSSEVLWKLGPF